MTSKEPPPATKRSPRSPTTSRPASSATTSSHPSRSPAAGRPPSATQRQRWSPSAPRRPTRNASRHEPRPTTPPRARSSATLSTPTSPAPSSRPRPEREVRPLTTRTAAETTSSASTAARNEVLTPRRCVPIGIRQGPQIGHDLAAGNELGLGAATPRRGGSGRSVGRDRALRSSAGGRAPRPVRQARQIHPLRSEGHRVLARGRTCPGAVSPCPSSRARARADPRTCAAGGTRALRTCPRSVACGSPEASLGHLPTCRSEGPANVSAGISLGRSARWADPTT